MDPELAVEMASLKRNFIVHGLPEQFYKESAEELKKSMGALLLRTMGVEIKIENCVRLGKTQNPTSQPRPVKMVVADETQVTIINSNKSKLRGTTVSISPDLPQDVRQNRRALREFCLEESIKGKTTRILAGGDQVRVGDKLYFAVNGKVCLVDQRK